MNTYKFVPCILNRNNVAASVVDMGLDCNDSERFPENRTCRTSQAILREYQNAGEKRRFEMWLLYQGLRGVFDNLE